jgi:hypothetical protein
MQAETTVKLSYSEPIPASRTTNMLNSGQINDKIYSIKFDRGEYSLLVYDENLKFLKETSFKKKNCKEGECITKDFDYKKTMFFEDRILVFFTTFETSSKQLLLLCQSFDLNGEFMGKLTLIDKIESGSRWNSGEFRLEQSKDKSKFVAIQIVPFDKNSPREYLFKVYDKDLKNISNSKIELPYKERNTSIVNYRLSNKGNVYMLVRVLHEKDKRQKGEARRMFELLSHNTATDNSLFTYNIQLPKKNIVDIDLQIDDANEQVSCAGFYSDIKSSTYTTDIDGVFYLNVDVNSGKLLSESYKPIDSAMVARLLGKKEGATVKEGKGMQSSFSIDYFVKLPDGSSYVIAENTWITVTTSCGKSGCTTTYTYHYNAMFAIKISQDGQVETLIDVPKVQKYNAPNPFFSYSIMQKDDKVFLLYNDNPKNISPEIKSIRDVKKLTATTKGALTLVELLPDGKYVKTQLFVNIKQGISTRVKNVFRLNEGSYVVLTKNTKGSEFKFMRIDLE